MFLLSFHNWYRFRHALLAIFGAKLKPNTKIRASVRINCPWNLTIGELAMIGDNVTLDARLPIAIGDRAVVSQMCVITTALRDPFQSNHPLTALPITIESDCWIAADSLVLPGTTVRKGTVIGARSVVEGELPPWTVAIGDPATPRGKRAFNIDSDSV